MEQAYADRLLSTVGKAGSPSSPASSPGDRRSSSCRPRYTPSSFNSRSPFSPPFKRTTPSSHGSTENYYDRFIPSRKSPCVARKCLFGSPGRKRDKKDTQSEPPKLETLTYQSILQNELLGKSITEVPDPQNVEHGRVLGVLTPSNEPVFKYKSHPCKLDPLAPYSISPVSKDSNKLLLSPRRAARKISKTPFKVLDAPELQDDFYLNLLDWSSLNMLSVGLGSAVYLWSACTCQVSRLCDLNEDNNTVTSVSWSERGHFLAVGTHQGLVQIWDASSEKKVSTLRGHTMRVGSLSWNGDVLCSGSRDHNIFQWDHRAPQDGPVKKYIGHTQEVCGLRWSHDHQLLASGGNDNKLLVWNQSSAVPLQKYSEHSAAIKAITWSPHQHGILASGGGTADKTIRFWNTLTGQPLQSIDTGSQVCNLAWSKSANELISTHGYSQNQIIIWRYPSLTQVAKLMGHTTRVLYLAMSPDGQTVVTGAGDETLRFWNVFYKSRSHKEPNSPLNMATYIR